MIRMVGAVLVAAGGGWLGFQAAIGMRTQVRALRQTSAGLALLERDRPHEVRWAHPETRVVRTFRITGERDWEICLAAVLSDHAPLRGRSILESSLTLGQEPVYQIHISGKEEPDGSA